MIFKEPRLDLSRRPALHVELAQGTEEVSRDFRGAGHNIAELIPGLPDPTGGVIAGLSLRGLVPWPGLPEEGIAEAEVRRSLPMPYPCLSHPLDF